MRMKRFLIMTSQKNDIFQLVQDAGLNPLAFEWGEEKTGFETKSKYVVSVLKHADSGFHFKFDRTGTGKPHCSFSPGDRSSGGESSAVFDWNHVRRVFQNWLSYLKAEIAPDLWEQVKGYAPQEAIVEMSHISNAPFSYLETERILRALDELETQMRNNFNLQKHKVAFVKKQLDYLRDAAKRQGRKDWVHTSIGVVATIAMGLVLSPEKTKLLWDLVRSCFAGILQLPAP